MNTPDLDASQDAEEEKEGPQDLVDLEDLEDLDPEALAHLEQRMQSTFAWGAAEWAANAKGNEKIATAYVTTAMRLLTSSGTIAQLKEWRARSRKSNAGRKAVIPIEAVMVLFLTHVQAGLGVTWGELAQTLRYRLNDKTRQKLGITLRTGSERAWYHRMWRAANALMALIDPYPAPRDRIMEGEAWTRLRDLANSAEYQHASAVKQARLDWLCNQLVHASVRFLPADILSRYHGNGAFDATPLQIRGRANAASDNGNRSNPDPFSKRYKRDGDHKGNGKKTDIAAYELETMVMVWNKPGESTAFPSLTTAVGMHTPGKVKGEAVKLEKWHQRLGYRRHLFICDRLYSDSLVEEFHLPMRMMGGEAVFDYRVDQLGLQGWYEDIILVDGSWYVNWMPEDLITASSDYRRARDTTDESRGRLRKLSRANNPTDPKVAAERDEATNAAKGAAPVLTNAARRIEARERYRLIPHGKPDKDGFQRFTYPDPASSLVNPTPSKPRKSITIPPLLPETLPPPHLASLAKTPDETKRKKGTKKPQPLKFVQKFPYLSEEWKRHYGMRNLVEAQNKHLKHGAHEDLGNKDKRSGRGYVFTFLVAALAVASSNLRRIRTFFQAEAIRLTAPTERERRRQNEHGDPLGHLTPEVHSNAPPS